MYSSLISSMTQDSIKVPPLSSMNFNIPVEKDSAKSELMIPIMVVYYSIFNDKNQEVSLKDILPFKELRQEGSVCNKHIKRNQISFRCYDCLLHEGSLICESCFSLGKHSNHRYNKVKQQGTCDCGNDGILKEMGFCEKHLKNVHKSQNVLTNERIVLFNLIVKKIFIWIFTVYSQHDQQKGIVFLYHFLKYLADMNKQSTHYNKLTTQIFFGNEMPIIRQIFELVLSKSTFEGPLTRITVELLTNMMPLSQFKVALFPILIDLYNKYEDFETSKFEKLLIVLLCDAKTVQTSMKNRSIILNPTGRRYNIRKYYEHLFMISFLQPEIAQLFIAPLIEQMPIPCFLMKRLQKCEEQNIQPLSVITENIENEFLYYQLMFVVISKVQDRYLLGKILINYYKMMMENDFYKNKIVLVPQRIFALCLFKYFNFKVEEVDPQKLRTILGISSEQFQKFLWRYFKQVLICLLQFGLNIVRNTYFYNYMNVYVKQQSQIVMVDYLAIKVITQLFINLGQEFSLISSIMSYYKSGLSHIEFADLESRKDYFDRWNKLIEILGQIVYSPKVEVINCIFLKATNQIKEKGIQLIVGISKSLGKISIQDLDRINKQFYHKQCPQQWIHQALSLNKQQKKYQLKYPEQYEDIEALYFQLLVSITLTSFSGIVQNEKAIKAVQLDDSQQSFAKVLLNKQFLQNFFKYQLELSKKLEIYCLFKAIPEFIRVTRLINHLQVSPINFEPFYEQCKEMAQNFVKINSESKNQDLIAQSKGLLDLISKSIISQNCQQSKNKAKQQLQRRKQLAKQKKERLFKQRKMKENQQKFMHNIQNPLKNQKQQDMEECLICKEKQSQHKLCYLSKIKMNNLMYDDRFPESKHIIFTSCFHMVHFKCFKNQLSVYRRIISCPLCKTACNITMVQNDHIPEQLEAINEHIFSTIVRIIKNYQQTLFFESIYSLSYLLLLNLEEGKPMTEKQLLLCRGIYSYIHYELKNYKNVQNKQAQYHGHKNFSLLLLDQIYSLILQSLKKSKHFQKPFSEIISKNTFKLRDMIRSEQFRNLVNNLIKVVEPQYIKKQENFMIPEEKNKVQLLPHAKQLPLTLTDFFKLRDSNRCIKSFTHTTVLCTICGVAACKDCQTNKDHTRKCHIDEALFFNLQTGGLVYNHCGLDTSQLNIRSLFINKLGTVWHPELQSTDFNLDIELYEQIWHALKTGNLFYFLIHNFEGLKGKGIHDII